MFQDLQDMEVFMFHRLVFYTLALTLSGSALAIEGRQMPIFLFNGNEKPIDQIESRAMSNWTDPGERMATVQCQSEENSMRFCPVPGHILAVRLMKQVSRHPCMAGRTFGAKENSVWVRAGCWGVFIVKVTRI